MKAISLWQPWASLVAAGIKTIETRAWRAVYRGPLAIHAAQRIEVASIPDRLRPICEAAFGADWPDALPAGALVAIAELVGCDGTGVGGAPPDWVAALDYPELACGNFAPRHFGWHLAEVRALDPPIPYRGRQGLFDVPDAVVAAASDNRDDDGDHQP